MTHGETSDNRLPSDRLKNFQEALETLYIKQNRGGRLQFLKDWPDAALSVFGDELSLQDRDGLGSKERKAELEEEAEDRRLILLEIASTLEAKSANNGALRAEYVQDVVTGLGRGTALYLYAKWIVDKFIPPPPEPEPDPASMPEVSKAASLEAPVAPIVLDLSASAPPAPMPEPEIPAPLPTDDPMDAIRPISVGPAPAPAAETPPASSIVSPISPIAPPAPKTGLNITGITENNEEKKD